MRREAALQVLQRFCEDGGGAVRTTIVMVVELKLQGIEIKCQNVALSDQNTDMDGELVETRATGRTMRDRHLAAKDQIEALKTQQAGAQLALKKVMGESSKTDDNLGLEWLLWWSRLAQRKRGSNILHEKLRQKLATCNSYRPNFKRLVGKQAASWKRMTIFFSIYIPR